MGCCLGILLLGSAPRIALLLWWFLDPVRVVTTFNGWTTTLGGIAFPVWAWPVAGFLLLPWTTIAYIFVAPGGMTTISWVIVGIGLLLDLGTHGGSGRAYRQRRYAE
jgi:hypothetical protein